MIGKIEVLTKCFQNPKPGIVFVAGSDDDLEIVVSFVSAEFVADVALVNHEFICCCCICELFISI